MGACGSRKKKQLGLQPVKVGGGEHGHCKWLKLKGCEIQLPVDQTQWEMKFDVDAVGQVSGGNKNDVSGAIKKHYTGTYKNGYLDCIANFEDGAQISYKGIVEKGVLKVKCEVLAAGSNNNYTVGDIAEAYGPLKYE